VAAVTTSAEQRAASGPLHAPPRRVVPAARWFDLGVGVVIALQLAVYALVALPGSFYLDDIAATSSAAGSDLDWSYLRGPAGHHLAPAATTWVWLQGHLMPLEHTNAVLITLALQAVVTFALARLLRSLVGPRPLALLPLVLYALTPLSLPTFAWWIQSVCLLPVHLSIIGATHQHLAYLRSRRLRHAVGAGAWVLFGLLFWEKAALAVVLPVLLTLVCFTSGPGLRARVVSLLRPWPGWVALALPPVAFAAVYSQQDRQPARAVSLGEVGRLLWDSSTHMVGPSLLGGPWRWTTKEFYGIARPTGGQVVVSGLLLLLLVGVSLLRRRQAWRGWLLLVLYVPASLAPVAAGRLAQYGVVVGRDSRYLTDIAVAAAVALALVLLPVRTGPDEPPAVAAPGRRVGPALLAGALVVAFLASAAVSTVRFAERWHENPSGDYLARLQQDLQATPGSDALYDGPLPVDVLSPFYAPNNQLSALLRQLPGQARFQDGLVPLKVVRPDGHVVAGRLQVAARSQPGPDGSCGYAVKPDGPAVHVPLDRSVYDFVARTARVELLLSAPTRVRVDATSGGERRRVGDDRVLPRGPAAVVAQVPGGDLDGLDIGGLAPGAYACVLSVTVGTPVPLGRG
jgi:hypothetical protein